jgi:hypothetical protein
VGRAGEGRVVRRILLTTFQADDLENEVTGWIAARGYDKKRARLYLKLHGLPKDAIETVFKRVDEVLHLVACVESEPWQRDLYESVVDGYGRIDSTLDKCFRVKGKRPYTRKLFVFKVG